MKQFVVAALSLAGLLTPAVGTSQGMQCVLVCNPPRVYCAPPGAPLPPIYTMCKTAYSETGQSGLVAQTESAQAPACIAEQVFNEETQAYEWQMSCD